MSTIEEAKEYLECHPVLTDGSYFAEHNNIIKNLITELDVADKVVDAAKNHIHFDLKLYLKDKELGNLEHRDKKVIRLLDSLKEYEELK